MAFIGYTLKKQGFKGFKKIDVGTPVYSRHNIYYLWQEHESGSYCQIVEYYPENIKPIIYTPRLRALPCGGRFGEPPSFTILAL